MSVPETKVLEESGGALPEALLPQVFATYERELYGALYHLIGSAEDARDALQEAFVRCWQHRAEVPAVVNLKAWVFRIALNVGRDIRKSAWTRRRTSLPEDSMPLRGHEARAERDAVRREELDLLREALRDLRPEEQEIFLLRQNGELTYEEIAETTGIPVGTVKTRMRLALKNLRAKLMSRRADP